MLARVGAATDGSKQQNAASTWHCMALVRQKTFLAAAGGYIEATWNRVHRSRAAPQWLAGDWGILASKRQ